MKNFITQFSRVFVGLLFIISGLIKLNDPVGFSFKLEEYFSADVLNLEFLIPMALLIACVVVIFEVVLGVMLLIGYKTKFTVYSLLGMIVFFTFLTFYSAYFNKVTDCGCFGDALKLTPWESFTKDIVLLFFIAILFINQRFIKPLFSVTPSNLIVFISYTGCFVMAYMVLNHLPFIDFRAYAVGTDIKKGMEIPEGAPKSVYEMTFIYNVNGVETEFSEAQAMNGEIPDGAEFLSRPQKLISKGYEPPIHDFSIEKDGEDYTESVLEEEKVMLFVTYDLNKAKEKGLLKLNDLYKTATEKGYLVIGLTASTEEIIKEQNQIYSFDFEYYFCDGTTLKTIERANPSIIVLNKGVITQKVHFNDINKLEL